MLYLLMASLLWAPSFGFIKHALAGLDPVLVAFARLSLSLLLFAPFARPGRVGWATAGRLIWIGAIQYGVMYMAYIASYRYLDAHEVAIFTVFTPLYVTLIHDADERRFRRFFLLTSLLAVMGAGLIVCSHRDPGGTLTGFLLIQGANICFAYGQTRYRGAAARLPVGVGDGECFGLLYFGAVLVTGLCGIWTSDISALGLSSTQVWVLVYLGIVPSGVGFFLWNVGARRVNAGTLAAMNNVKIPLAVLVAVLAFGERPAWWPVLVGGMALVAAVLLTERYGAGSLGPAEGLDDQQA